MSFNATMFSCLRCLRSFISRSVLLASVGLSNALLIFLMATFSCVSSFLALQVASREPQESAHATGQAPYQAGTQGAAPSLGGVRWFSAHCAQGDRKALNTPAHHPVRPLACGDAHTAPRVHTSISKIESLADTIFAQ